MTLYTDRSTGVLMPINPCSEAFACLVLERACRKERRLSAGGVVADNAFVEQFDIWTFIGALRVSIEYVQAQKTNLLFNESEGSYALKHYAEHWNKARGCPYADVEWRDLYVPNGIMCAAIIGTGADYKLSRAPRGGVFDVVTRFCKTTTNLFSEHLEAAR